MLVHLGSNLNSNAELHTRLWRISSEDVMELNLAAWLSEIAPAPALTCEEVFKAIVCGM